MRPSWPHFALILAVLGGCADDRFVGGSGAETTNTIGVVVVDAEGLPVQGARVNLRDPDDTTSSGGVLSDGAGHASLPVPHPGRLVWIEAGTRFGTGALSVSRPTRGEVLRLQTRPNGSIVVTGVVPGGQVALPGLGRLGKASDSGVVVFSSVPSGVVRLRSANFDAPVPVSLGREIRIEGLSTEPVVPWPLDGSLDSLAIRRFLDQSGLEGFEVDSVARTLDGRRAHLDFSGLGLDSLSGAIGSLGFLREIDLRENRIAALPASLARLPRLSALFLSRNPMAAFPDVLRGADSLRILAMDSTSLEALPAWVGELGNLWYLGLGWNQLDSLPEGLSRLSRLSSLAIQRNRIVALPEGIHRMDSLSEIWAETNLLRKLPDSLFRARSLKILQVDRNPLDSLPSRLGESPSLVDLRVGTTSLRTLPASLMDLRLERLDVWGTAFCDLPPSMEGWLDSLAGTDWREKRSTSCP
ncbi:MAG: hypothetical protein H6686_12960 [Fibrobacteria bacterium]|nr:hypothetical protein [Fibrobacteria bacterium]